MSAACYAEFACRVPKAGSAYVYIYLTLGELAAFVIGWNLILEHSLAVAAISRAAIGYIDALTNEAVQSSLPTYLQEHSWDYYSVIFIIIIGILVCCGIKSTTLFMKFFSGINILVLCFVIACGLALADINNWQDFLPFGAASIFEGAATAYYGFIGYDIITVSSEEAITPGRSVPIAIMLTVLIVNILYLVATIVFTLMIPYTEIIEDAGLSSAFGYNGWKWAETVISVGAVAAMTAAIIMSAVAMTRAVYAMACDGTIFKFLGRVNSKTQVPVIATIAVTIITCLSAFFIDLEELAQMFSLGTLLAYMLVALGSIVIRFHPLDLITGEPFEVTKTSENAPLFRKHDTWQTEQTCALLAFVVFTIFANVCLAVIPVIDNNGAAVSCYILLEENQLPVEYKIPFSPYFPAASAFLNMYLMTQLNLLAWTRVGIWLVMGLAVYAFYGNFHSTLENTDRVEKDIEKIDQ
ncbi:cationic amino acid transporter 2-like, partial [Convolutriloba macropyga]|uniref:cationic amino acid transporter 2-like n=1 Tax=Convolutriloba macropyga TaxID=536237 RepID=UPI003F524DD7